MIGMAIFSGALLSHTFAGKTHSTHCGGCREKPRRRRSNGPRLRSAAAVAIVGLYTVGRAYSQVCMYAVSLRYSSWESFRQIYDCTDTDTFWGVLCKTHTLLPTPLPNVCGGGDSKDNKNNNTLQPPGGEYFHVLRHTHTTANFKSPISVERDDSGDGPLFCVKENNWPRDLRWN